MKVRTTHTLNPRTKNALRHHLKVDELSEDMVKDWMQSVITAELERAEKSYDRSTSQPTSTTPGNPTRSSK